MKVLIVDDEAYVRIGMRTIVNWGELGITMVMEAADGLQALKIFKEIRPDIVLLDIVMPNMNGLEFIRAAKQLKNNCKFLILSCMDELDYYKDAINLGVSGYVLKNSLTGEHLTTVISNLIKEIDTEQIRVPSNNEIFTYASNDIVLNEFTSLALKGKIEDKELIKDKIYSSFLMPDDDRIYMFMLDFSDNEKPGKILHRIAALSQETIQAICNGKVFINHDDVIWGMLSYSSIQSGNNYAIDVAKQLRLTLTQFMSCEIKISLASEDKNSFDLVSLYDKCRKTLYRAFVEAGDVFTWKPVKNPNAKKEIKRIIENFGKDIGYNELINKLTDISNILTNSPIIPPIQIKRIYEMIISSYVQRFPDYNNLLSTLIEGYDTLRKYLRSSNNLPDLLFRATTILNELNSSRPDTEDLMITNIKNYIKSNINFKISLTDISSRVHLNSSYLCSFFKLKTGRHLSDYILKTKINTAKAYLHKNISVSDVAKKLSFSSDTHFIKTFKKYEGITPGAFAKNLQRGIK